jgi:hypothetical protein
VALLTVFDELSDSIPNRPEWLRSQDMEWHNLNPNEGLYYALRQTGQVERIVPDDLIEYAMRESQDNTRAYVRGKTQQLLNKEGEGRELRFHSWEQLAVVDAEYNRGNKTSTVVTDLGQQMYWSEATPNPRDPGRELLEKIRVKIAKGE